MTIVRGQCVASLKNNKEKGGYLLKIEMAFGITLKKYRKKHNYLKKH